MSWTYDGDPSASALAYVRFLIGDTDTTDQQLTDEEINYILSINSDNAWQSAIQCAQTLGAKYQRRADSQVGDLRISASQIAKGYWDMAKRLQSDPVAAAGVAPYAGGISVADKDANRQETDRVPPAFTRDLMFTPGDRLTPWDTDTDADI